jgi:membrane protein DedA with SNARE-associated domain
LIDHIASYLLSLPTWLALLLVFALPALEASIFLGFVVPGEIALILGGVLASAHQAPLWAVIVCGVVGAVVGDSIGYFVGRRWGERVLESSVGRFVKREHLDRARGYLAARGGRAVFLGRFTAALRALMPGMAGMAPVPYRVFLRWNIAGGALWGLAAVLLGYVAGASWQKAAHLASGFGLGVLVVIVLLVGGGVLYRRLKRGEG